MNESFKNSVINHSEQDRLPNNSKSIGQLAENAAYEYLLARGLKPISRNYKISAGEIDIILEDNNDIVFAEVRFRKNNHFGDGAESVTGIKQKKIYKTALHFIQKHPKLAKRNFRFDVISISPSGSQFDYQFDIDWIDDAFQPES